MTSLSSQTVLIDTAVGQPVDRELMKKCIMKAKIFKAVAAAFERTKHDRLARVLEKISTYKLLIRTGVGGRAAARAAKVVLDELEVGQLESFVEQRRHPHIPGCGFPSIELLQFASIRFSGMHMDQGCGSREIMTCQHFGWLPDTSLKKVPLMVALMDKLERDGVQGKATPFEWQLLLDAFGQAKSAAAVNLETLHPVTLLAWQTGYDATMSETSQTRVDGKQ